MEGGMTRRRGYVWLTILFLVATGVLLASQPKGTSPSLPHLPDSLVPTTDSLSPSSQPNPMAPTASAWHAIPKKKPLVFELNSADSLDLVQLYNIGPTIARRILKYRSLLGGYYCKEQLHEVYGIDSARYADIAPHLTVNSALVTRLDLNTATIDQLKRHPYLDYYQAKAIVRMREEKGAFNQVSDILNIPIIDTETFKHIEPYLTCNSQPNK
jgi:DNA uptake protein ComE-like DNA-binding protein